MQGDKILLFCYLQEFVSLMNHYITSFTSFSFYCFARRTACQMAEVHTPNSRAASANGSPISSTRCRATLDRQRETAAPHAPDRSCAR